MARGWAMMLVIFAHTPIPGKLSSYIYSFHVPLFFIISGFLLHSGLSKSPSDFIKNKIIRLAIPYFFFSAIAYLYWLAARHLGWDYGAQSINPMIPLNGTIMAIRNSNFMTHNAALWFICALFVSEIAFYLLHKCVKKDKFLLIAGVVLIAILGIVYNTFDNIPLPWAVDTMPIVLVFLCAGYFMREYYPKWKKVSGRRLVLWGSLAALFASSLLFWHLNKTSVGTVDMFYGIYGSFPLYFLAAFSGSLFVMMIAENLLPKMKWLTYVGQNSLIIYALHQKVIFGVIAVILTALFGKSFLFLGYTSLEKIGNGLTYLILTLLMAVPIIWFLSRYGAPLIGRGKLRASKK